MKKEVRQIPLNAINPDPTQPRKDFDEEELEELAQSIRRNGLLQPITVKSNRHGQFTIIAGERRYRAHQILDAETVECIVYNGKNAKELQLIENINRKDLNPIEVVQAYRSYLDAGHTLEELSEVVGKPKNILSWLLNLENCRPEVKHMVTKNQMSMVVGISLSKLTDNGQLQALRTMQSTKLNVSECQQLSQRIFAHENQDDMFADEPKLDDKTIQVRSKIQGAMQRASQALQEIQNIELDNPGISAQAIAERLDITQENIDMLQKMLAQFKRSLEQKRVAALC
jgi:ParB family chromosome partitioning protein